VSKDQMYIQIIVTTKSLAKTTPKQHQ